VLYEAPICREIGHLRMVFDQLSEVWVALHIVAFDKNIDNSCHLQNPRGNICKDRYFLLLGVIKEFFVLNYYPSSRD
jgi:hypothetical protein